MAADRLVQAGLSLVLLLSGCAAPAVDATMETAPHVSYLELRPVVLTAAVADTVEFEGERLPLSDRVVVNDAHVRVVHAYVGDDGIILDVHLTPDGDERLREHTAAAALTGERLALLIGGQALSAPTVRSAVGSPFHAMAEMPAARAEQLAAEIRARWPRQ